MPTAGKLWEGKWKIISLKSPTTVKISNGKQHKVVHVNRLQSPPISQPWSPSEIEHFILPASPELRRNPPRNRHPPDYYRPE